VIGLLGLAAVATIPAAICCLFEASFMGLERARYVTVGTLMECVLRFGGGGLALFLGYGLVGVFVTLALSRAIMLCFYWIALRQYAALRWRFQPRRMRWLLNRWWMFAGENWLATFYSTLDVLLLSYFRNEATVGLYASGLRIARLGSTTIRCYTVAVYPVLSRLHKTSLPRFRHLHLASLRMMLALTLPVALTVTLYAEQVMTLIFGNEFLAGAAALRVVIWALVFESVNPFLSHTLFARDAQSNSFRVAIVGFSTRLALFLVLIPMFGMMGTAWAAVISGYLATLCYGYFALSREDAVQFLTDTMRTTAALAGLSAVLLLTPHTEWLLGVGLGGALYAFLLIGLRVVRIADLRMNQT
jgi:O-antigen/teichoic acid export membrane protein